MDVEYKCRILDHESGDLVHEIEVTMTGQTAVPETAAVVVIADDTHEVSAAVVNTVWDFTRWYSEEDARDVAHVTVLLTDTSTDGGSYR